MEDKQEIILKDLKLRAQELRYGTITVEFKVHEGRLMKGDIIEEHKTLG